MITRVSSMSMQNNILAQIAANQNKLADLQMQAMTGQKVNSILDNPVDASKILTLKDGISRVESYQKNVSMAQSEYDTMDSTLAIVADKLQRINELANAASNEYHTAESLESYKNELSTIKQTLIDMANTQYNGSYIFSGTNTTTPTYTINDDGSIIYGGTPQTDDYKRRLEVADGVYLTLNVAGDSIFGSYNAADGSGSGIFKMVSDLEAAIDKASSTDEAVRSAGFDAIRESINLAQDNITSVTATRTQYGTFAQKADLSETSLADNLIILKSDKSDIQEIDLIEAYSNLTYQQYALQASMQIASMSMQQSSLLNYI